MVPRLRHRRHELQVHRRWRILPEHQLHVCACVELPLASSLVVNRCGNLASQDLPNMTMEEGQLD